MITKEKLQRIVASYVDSPMLADELWHSIKTAQQQEPVVIDPYAVALAKDLLAREYNGATSFCVQVLCEAVLKMDAARNTSPQPSKPWVSLTEEEVKHEWIVWRASAPRYVGFAKGIEAKLKDKNAQPSKPLTDEQIKEIMWQKLGWTGCAPDDINFARAIEAAHGIKEKNNG